MGNNFHIFNLAQKAKGKRDDLWCSRQLHCCSITLLFNKTRVMVLVNHFFTQSYSKEEEGIHSKKMIKNADNWSFDYPQALSAFVLSEAEKY